MYTIYRSVIFCTLNPTLILKVYATQFSKNQPICKHKIADSIFSCVLKVHITHLNTLDSKQPFSFQVQLHPRQRCLSCIVKTLIYCFDFVLRNPISKSGAYRPALLSKHLQLGNYETFTHNIIEIWLYFSKWTVLLLYWPKIRDFYFNKIFLVCRFCTIFVSTQRQWQHKYRLLYSLTYSIFEIKGLKTEIYADVWT